jgi:hypothetical protein
MLIAGFLVFFLRDAGTLNQLCHVTLKVIEVEICHTENSEILVHLCFDESVWNLCGEEVLPHTMMDKMDRPLFFVNDRQPTTVLMCEGAPAMSFNPDDRLLSCLSF